MVSDHKNLKWLKVNRKCYNCLAAYGYQTACLWSSVSITASSLGQPWTQSPYHSIHLNPGWYPGLTAVFYFCVVPVSMLLRISFHMGVSGLLGNLVGPLVGPMAEILPMCGFWAWLLVLRKVFILLSANRCMSLASFMSTWLKLESFWKREP